MLKMTFMDKYKDDIIYLCLLIFSIIFGHFYSRLDSPVLKKRVGTIIGLVLIYAVSGVTGLHIIISTLIGVTLIKTSGKKNCHVATFFFMFGYLFFFRASHNFGLPIPSGHTNLIQMIAVLKVVGVAFEINGSWQASKREKVVKDEKAKDDDYTELIDPTFIDLLHYAFNYVGVLTGPYFRYRTFHDFLHLPFSKSADCFGATIHKLRWVPLYISLFLTFANIWPLNYIETEDFANRNFLYRAMYIWPAYTTFRFRIYTGLTLSECVCSSAGLGAYPVSAMSRYGHGPTVKYSELEHISEDKAATLEYDFNTIQSIEAWLTESTPLFRDSMKVWNKCVQYWVGMYVYKRFPVKVLRTHVTLLVSVLWHGWHAGYFFCLYIAPFYLVTEDIYCRLFYKDATGLKKKVVTFILWFLRVHYQSYAATGFLLLTLDRIWPYYSSLYHYPYVLWLFMLFLGLGLVQARRGSKVQRQAEDNKLEEKATKEKSLKTD